MLDKDAVFVPNFYAFAMKYSRHRLEDFIQDEYFQQWVLEGDSMTCSYWENWLAKHPDKKETAERAKKAIRLMANDEDTLSEADFNRIWQHIVERKGRLKHVPGPDRSPRIIFGTALRVAAVFLGLLALSYGVYQLGGNGQVDKFPVNSQPQVTLELQDGTIRTMDEKDSGIITTANGTKVVNQQQQVLLYNSDHGDGVTLAYNQLTVPNGRKFELILSDGSHVFLNSGSKLRYPVKFLKDRPRDVFLDGEAYFSVTKDEQRAFTVVTDGMNTQVYGTEFNVSNYKNERDIFTVLLEGSVGVYRSNNDQGSPPIKIEPGQRAIFNNGQIDVQQANVHKYIAWKEGRLIFMDDRFELLLKKLERHFNVTIDNRFIEFNEKRFTGTFMTESLEQILQICQQHTPFQYQRTGNTIVITPPKEPKTIL